MKCITIEISNGRGTIKTMTNSTEEEINETQTQLYDAIKLNTNNNIYNQSPIQKIIHTFF